VLPKGCEDAGGSLIHLRRFPGEVPLDETEDGLALRSAANGTKSLIRDLDPLGVQNRPEGIRDLAGVEDGCSRHIEND
jgi:hypothetical protein